MNNCIRIAIAGLLWVTPYSVSAQSLSGYCLDTVRAGCMPRFIPFHDMSIDFCEETCSLTNPVGVRGLNAVLYDLTCHADYESPLDGVRVMILRQIDRDGFTNISWIEENGTSEVVPCP